MFFKMRIEEKNNAYNYSFHYFDSIFDGGIKDLLDIIKELPNNLEESHLVFNTKGSYIQELNKDAFEEKKELDEYEIELKNKLNEAEEKFKENKKNKKDDDNNHENVKDIEKLIYESIEIINGDAMSIEPKLIPFIPGLEKNILLEKN